MINKSNGAAEIIDQIVKYILVGIKRKLAFWCPTLQAVWGVKCYDQASTSKVRLLIFEEPSTVCYGIAI